MFNSLRIYSLFVVFVLATVAARHLKVAARHLKGHDSLEAAIGARMGLQPETVKANGIGRKWWVFKTTNYPKIHIVVPNRGFPMHSDNVLAKDLPPPEGTDRTIDEIMAQLGATNVDDILKNIFAGRFGAMATALFAAIDSATPAFKNTNSTTWTGVPESNLMIWMKHQTCTGSGERAGASPFNGAASMDGTGSASKFDYNPCAYGGEAINPPTLVLHEAIHSLHQLKGARDKTCPWPPSGSCCCEEYRTVGLYAQPGEANGIPVLPDQYGGNVNENAIRAERRAINSTAPPDRTDYNGCTPDKVNKNQCTAFWNEFL